MYCGSGFSRRSGTSWVAIRVPSLAGRIHASRGCYREGWSPPANRRLAMSDTILAVDLGRYKSVACIYQRATRQHTFRTIDTTPEDVGRLLARHPGAVVVIEACAN